MIKNIIFFLLFAVCGFAQTYNVTFPFDSGAVYSDSIQFKDDNQFLAALFVSDTLDIDTFYIQVCFDSGTNDTTAAGAPIWYYLYYGGDRYVIIGDETDAAAITLQATAIYSVNEGTDPREIWVRLAITTDDKEVGPISIKGLTKTFK